MFEKEAEEYANQSCFTEMPNPSLSEDIDVSDEIKEAVLYGYNKANEWHYVKDGDLPKDMENVFINAFDYGINTCYVAYRAKRTTFRKDWRVFFDLIKGQTFTVSDAEYAVAEEKYKEVLQLCAEMRDKKGIVINPTFEIKGHVAWLYRLDEDYTEEIKKYESTHSKS